MKIFTFVTAVAGLAALEIVTAHTLFTNLIINDDDQGAGTCVRMPKNPSIATNPINNLAGEEMACGKCIIKYLSVFIHEQCTDFI